jgi:O-antigen/teichoic acid export membrane protein
LRQLLLQSTRLLGLLAVLGGVLLLIDGRRLLRLWVGYDLVSAYPLVAILALGYIINLVQHPTLLVVIAKGSHGPLGAWTIAEGVANIVLSVIWGRSHGLLGVAMGTVVPMLVIKMAIQPFYALKAAEMSPGEYLRRAIVRPIVVGLLFAAVATKIAIGSENSIPLFAATVLVQTLVFVAFTWFLGITRLERQWVSSYIRKHLHWPVLRVGVLRTQSSEADFR